VARGADAVLVHHGWFWRGEDGRLTGFRKRRMATLMQHDLNLIAYHLPLDAHPELGNNAQLAQLCGWQPEGRFGEQDIAWYGRLPEPLSAGELAARTGTLLGCPVQLVGPQDKRVSRLGWCSGGAQGYFEQAVALGLDAYISGEISEQNTHLARECGVPYLACGHHATERGGIRALSEWLTETTGLHCQFIDIDNPV